jgi:ferredoxin-NADP reductase
MAKLRLIRSTWLAEGVIGLDFAAPEPGGASAPELPSWTPGSHLTLHLAEGLSREYSLCGDPADRTRYTVAVQRDAASRGGSTHVHDRLRVGEIIDVDGPRNNFALDDDAPAYVLVAGGIGITPIRAMARELARRGARWRLLYCGRTRDRMAFLDGLTALGAETGTPGDPAADDGWSTVTFHVDEEAGSPADLAAYLAAAPADALVYACGPEPLLDALTSLTAGTGRDRLRLERFRPPERTVPASAETGFDVVCSAGRFSVSPGASVLQTLLDAGLDLPFSCQEGICGSCETGVVSGTPDHRDFLLSDEEKEAGTTMLLCVSRCYTSQLVLDL